MRTSSRWDSSLGSAHGIYAAKNLSVEPEFSNLIPESYPSVQALERIRATVGGGEKSVDLAIESPSFEANLAFAEALVPQALALQRKRNDEVYFIRAELRRDTEYLQNNALYFAQVTTRCCRNRRPRRRRYCRSRPRV